MPSTRRLKTIAVVLALVICTVFYLTARPPISPFYSSSLTRTMWMQNDARRAASQDFYTNTVNALNAAERSLEDTIPNLEHIKAAAKKGVSPNREEGPAKPVQGQQVQAPLEVAVPTKGLSDDQESDGKIIGGGPRKVKGGEKWDMATGKEAPPKDSKDEAKKESEEDHEIEVELNGILKKGPSMSHSLHGHYESPFTALCAACLHWRSNAFAYSNYLFEILLPLLRQSEKDPSREIHYYPRTIRSRAGSASIGPRSTSTSCKEHREKDSAKHLD